MKNLILMIFLFIGSISYSSSNISQEEFLEFMRPHLESSNKYEKFQLIDAKLAVEGEIVYTITSDGLETQNKAKEGDYLVRNRTEANEIYIMSDKKFKKRYTYLEKTVDGWGVYKPIGIILAVEVDTDLIRDLHMGKEFYFMAPWGEKMIVKKGDYLVSPLDFSEVYRIARKEFFETYKEKEKK